MASLFMFCALLTLLTSSRASDKACGVSGASSRIVRGKKSKPTDWPWVARLEVMREEETFSCTGSLIDSHWILTAAHCVTDAEAIRVFLGEDKNGLPGAHVFEEHVDHKRFFAHECYDTNEDEYDVALIRLISDPTAMKRAGKPAFVPICLPTEPVERDLKCVATGWGITQNNIVDDLEYLRETPVTVLSSRECHLLIVGCSTPDLALCARSDEVIEGQSSEGDSGGPLNCKREDGKWVVAGVTGAALLVGGRVQPNMYANMTLFTKWIRSKIAP